MFERLETVYDARLLVGEGPTWDARTGTLLFVDIRGQAVYRMDYASGCVKKIPVPQMPGCLGLCKNGDLLAAMEDGIYRMRDDGSLTLAHQRLTIKGERFNDGKVGPDGCYYAGTAGEHFSGAFYRLKNGVLTELFDGCGCSNGLAWSADARTLFYVDSRTQKLEKFAFSVKNHTVSDRQTVAVIPAALGCGDGMTIDAKGDLWLAVWGGSCVLHVESATGRILETVPVPAKQVSSCCFAGPDLRDLIITTSAVRTDPAEQPEAGKIFRLRTDVPGVLSNEYKEEP